MMLPSFAYAFVSSVISASSPVPSDEGFQCVPHGSHEERIVCAMNASEAADGSMANELQATLAALPSDRQAALRRKQARWLAYRESHCKEKTKGLEGGNAWAEALYGCLAKVSRARTASLKAMRPPRVRPNPSLASRQVVEHLPPSSTASVKPNPFFER